METPAVMTVVRNMVGADTLVKGSVIIERTDRGKISRTATVMDKGTCSDPGNVHYSVNVKSSGGVNAGVHVWCYTRCVQVEVKS